VIISSYAGEIIATRDLRKLGASAKCARMWWQVTNAC